MARIRTIKPSFWENLNISKVSRDARLLYIGMWNFADDLGVIPAYPVSLKSKIFPNEFLSLEEVECWLGELVKHGFIMPLEYNGHKYFFMEYFVHNQYIKKRNTDEINISVEVLEAHLEKMKMAGGTSTPLVLHQYSPIKERIGKESIGEEKKESKLSFSSPSGENKKTSVRHEREEEYRKFTVWVKKHTPFVAKLSQQMTPGEFRSLSSRYSSSQIIEILTQMNNYKALTKKYTNVYRTFLNWAKKAYE